MISESSLQSEIMLINRIGSGLSILTNSYHINMYLIKN